MLHPSQNTAIILLARKGHSHRSISRLTGHDRKTVRKVLELEVPSSPALEISTQHLVALRSLLARPVKSGGLTCLHLAQSLAKIGFAVITVGAHGRKSLCGEHEDFIARKAEQGLTARKIHEALVTELHFGGSYYSVRRFLQKLLGSKLGGSAPAVARSDSLFPRQHQCWMLRLLQGEIGTEELATSVRTGLASEDAELLVKQICTGRLSVRNRAMALAAHLKGVPFREIARFLFVTRGTVREYVQRFRQGGLPRVFDLRRKPVKKTDDLQYTSAVFKVLHAPPQEYGFNRTTWRMTDLKTALTIEGFTLSTHAIGQIIRKAGYRFRKAKIVLTSNDPEYRTKLQEITRILRNLKPDEKFFSVDEYGPFAVKIQGGLSLVKLGEQRTVPQYQKSKGSLIMTAALELSENQVTHFYSDRKNTDEMLKLLELLLEKYADQSCIYFSWDAASWHASKKLYKRVEEINSDQYQAKHNLPLVKLAPLPSCAQFLNVIESVFSGMARAIIHNSDYASVEVCKAAIDRHFDERNQHFKAHPKRAGNKIWGKELVAPEFSESNNCKDPRYRGGPHCKAVPLAGEPASARLAPGAGYP